MEGPPPNRPLLFKVRTMAPQHGPCMHGSLHDGTTTIHAIKPYKPTVQPLQSLGRNVFDGQKGVEVVHDRATPGSKP